MLCPKCTKKETSIVKELYESSTNTVKRQRECQCGNLFVTYEIDKTGLKSKPAKILKNSLQVKKKRKLTTKEEWLDFRVFLYGFMRMYELVMAAVEADAEFEEKFKRKADEKDIYGGAMKSIKNKKSYYTIVNIKTGEEIEIKLEGVKKTIKTCLNMDIYWKKRKNFFKDKIIPKKDDARAYSDEAQEYFRSITSNVKNNKYDNVFYNNNKYFEELLTALNIKEDHSRELIKRNFFASQKWAWFKEVR